MLSIHVFIKDIFLNSKIRNARVGIASPSEHVEDKFAYYEELKPKAMELYQFLIENDIELCIECNNIPYCVWTEAERNYFINHNYTMIFENICGNVLDHFLDGTTSHCFSTSSFDIIEDYQFKNYTELRQFYAELYKQIKREPFDKKCKTCNYANMCAQGCLAFHKEEVIKRYNELIAEYKNKGIIK